eukprot:9755069-Alexandrium_andersonii.AAC.1
MVLRNAWCEDCSLHESARCRSALALTSRGWECSMASGCEGGGGALGFLRDGAFLGFDGAEHRHHYVFAAVSRMGYVPQNL